MVRSGASSIDHFREIPMDSQTTDFTHFDVVFRYDVTIKALETLWSIAIYLLHHDELNTVTAKCVISIVWRLKFKTAVSQELENGLMWWHT